ncbi:MAG: zf-HC2 domain-containing protein [Betaproteobacteria bacterium]|nr:zf-HC2 domain-containing protein [Betaproteobacteria bacterium]
MMLTCKETTRLVSQGLDRELAFGERVALRVHLAICIGCRRTRRQMMFLRRAMRELVEIDLKAS